MEPASPRALGQGYECHSRAIEMLGFPGLDV
jgi:hypothetical protein